MEGEREREVEREREGGKEGGRLAPSDWQYIMSE